MANQNKQPTGMYVIACTEIFERFSYYTLSFLLVLYASDKITKGGLGWTMENALLLVSIYTFAAYTLPLIGGYLSDKYLGAYKASVFGGCLIVLGHLTLLFSSYNHLPIFYLAVSLVASGTAFFKPNMPTLLGRLYAPNDYSREGGFKLYYFGINLGAGLAGITNGLLNQHFGYRIALSSASIGMTLGLFVLILGKKHLVTFNLKEVRENASQTNTSNTSMSPLAKRALKYLGCSFVFFAFWAISYNLAVSGTLSLYLENFTNRFAFGYEIPTTFFSSLESIGILISAPILAYFFQALANKGRPFHFFSQMCLSIGIIVAALAYLLYLSHILKSGITPGTKPFYWTSFAIFMLAIAVSEVLISPVMMCAISVLAPVKSRSLWQAAYLTIIGLMSLVAGKIGAMSLHEPFKTFLWLTVATFSAFLIFLILLKRFKTVANEAANELED